MILVSLVIVSLAVVAALTCRILLPEASTVKVVVVVSVLAIVVETGFLIWVHKAANTMPPGAQLMDREDVSDKE